jgi:hypothetical protein
MDSKQIFLHWVRLSTNFLIDRVYNMHTHIIIWDFGRIMIVGQGAERLTIKFLNVFAISRKFLIDRVGTIIPIFELFNFYWSRDHRLLSSKTQHYFLSFEPTSGQNFWLRSTMTKIGNIWTSFWIWRRPRSHFRAKTPATEKKQLSGKYTSLSLNRSNT